MAVEVKIVTKEIGALMAAVDKERPEPGAVAKLRAYLVENPTICEAIGDLVYMAEHNAVTRSFSDKSLRIAITMELEKMRDGLGYADADPLERSLIAHVVMCWLRLGDCELRYHMATGGSLAPSQALFWEKKLAANQRRYLKACETLAKVRKLQEMEPSRPTPALNILLKQQLALGRK